MIRYSIVKTKRRVVDKAERIIIKCSQCMYFEQSNLFGSVYNYQTYSCTYHRVLVSPSQKIPLFIYNCNNFKTDKKRKKETKENRKHCKVCKHFVNEKCKCHCDSFITELDVSCCEEFEDKNVIGKSW